MSISAVSRLQKMPPVINVSNIHHLEELPRTQVSVMLHRWVKQGLVRRLAPRAGVYFNLIADRCWQDHLDDAVSMAMPSAVRVGETVLQAAGWTTQVPLTPAYAVVEGDYADATDAKIVKRTLAWYKTVSEGGGKSVFLHASPILAPAWALADALAHNDLWVPAPDDLYDMADDGKATAAFIGAWNALMPEQALPKTALELPLEDAYALAYDAWLPQIRARSHSRRSHRP